MNPCVRIIVKVNGVGDVMTVQRNVIGGQVSEAGRDIAKALDQTADDELGSRTQPNACAFVSHLFGNAPREYQIERAFYDDDMPPKISDVAYGVRFYPGGVEVTVYENGELVAAFGNPYHQVASLLRAFKY